MGRPSSRLAAVHVALVALAACGCREHEARREAPNLLLSQARSALVEREQKVQGFRLRGVAHEKGASLGFLVAFRAPDRVRVELDRPAQVLAFDGRKLVRWQPEARHFQGSDLTEVGRAKAAALLHRTFAPFVPEGWRTPLLAGHLAARWIELDGGSRTLELAAVATSGAEEVEVRYAFAPGSMDFLGKKVRGGGQLEVTEQHCVPRLQLCFPRTWVTRASDGTATRTSLSEVEVDPALPPEYFSIEPPEGVVEQSLPVPQ